ncbi:MAG: glycosyltransferase [Candidatus Omnitrophica bacterium]|nr:glycosyltransferase [Candidatus Omnitrophota bacterium]
MTLYCSSLLFDEEREECRQALFVDHGVDYDLFSAAGDRAREGKDDVLGETPHPRVGYVGNLEPHRVDYKMFLKVAEKLSHLNFVVVGPSALPEDWCTLPNVHQFGQQPYEEVPKYMAACDVLIMPWNENEWIKACNPVKLKEYLAVGRPVVTSPFEELRNYSGFVRIASGDEAFGNEIEKALDSPEEVTFLRERVEKETWKAKAELVVGEVRRGLPQAHDNWHDVH